MQTHIIIICHGLLGSPKHLTRLISTIESIQSNFQNTVFIANSYQMFLSYDGIDVCARRVLQELETLVPTLNSVTRYSVVGYSLGGLIARYLVALIDAHSEYSKWIPCAFITLATPHLGIKSNGTSSRDRIVDTMAGVVISRTGEQLVLQDNYRESGPLLRVMADPRMRFHHALAKFQHRILYANTINDRTVPFWTASILDVEKIGPYMIANVVDREVTCSKEYPGIVTHFSPPGFNTVKTMSIPMYRKATLAVLSPILLLGVVGLSTYANVASAIRQRRVISTFAPVHILPKPAKMVTLPTRLLDAMEGEEIPEDELEAASEMFTKCVSSQELMQEDHMDTEKSEPILVKAHSIQPDFIPPLPTTFPKLSLEHEEMSKNLNMLAFTKYYCHLDHFRSHACIVARNGEAEWAIIGAGVQKHLQEVGFPEIH
jgi:hypothetical protein